jgi:hypothetical protein
MFSMEEYLKMLGDPGRLTNWKWDLFELLAGRSSQALKSAAHVATSTARAKGMFK